MMATINGVKMFLMGIVTLSVAGMFWIIALTHSSCGNISLEMCENVKNLIWFPPVMLTIFGAAFIVSGLMD
jgi:hypothetical protein